ncbi:MAG: CotH kinase family protein, partial [Verrucomicrobiota bacterium]
MRGLRSGLRTPGLALAVVLLSAGLTPAGAQAELRLDPDSLRLQDGRLSFQFEWPSGGVADFEVQTADSLPVPPALPGWSAGGEATLEGITDGVFRVAVPLGPGGERYIRVRSRVLPPAGPAPVINEVMADNDTAHAAGPGRYWDWIELFNPHDEAVVLQGYTLGPAGAAAGPAFPATRLQPGGYLLVYATDSAEPPPAGTRVIAPGLPSGGGPLVLRDRFGREVERFDVPPLAPDQSVGRVPDGADTWQLFAREAATPGRTNGPAGSAAVIEAPRFFPEGGLYPGPVEVTLVAALPGLAVAFTTNGSPATAGSPRLAAPLRLAAGTVVRAVAVDSAGRASREAVHSYLVGIRHSLPVVSLAAAATNFDFRTGYLIGMGPGVLSNAGQVLANFPFEPSNAWRDREIPVHLEFFEPGGRAALRQAAGMKVHGGWGSRGYPQKSFSLFARRKYGAGSVDHGIFPGLGIDRFESLVLRNSGNDNQSTYQTAPRSPITQFGTTATWGSYFVRGNFTLMRDAMMQRLLDGTGLDTQAYRPAVFYLNGEYWGLHNLREKTSEHQVADHHELPGGVIDLIEGYGTVRAGGSAAYTALRDYLNLRGVTDPANYDFVARTYLEVDNFIDYHLAVIYFQNFDIGNIKCWRPRVPNGRFRWMVYDQDYGFGLWPSHVYPAAMARDYADYGNMFRFATANTGTSTAWPNGGGRTLFLRRMLANAQFKERFIRRCADLLNSHFREDRVARTIQEMAAVIRPEIPAHLARWSWPALQARGYGLPHQREAVPLTPERWEEHVAGLLDFGQSRPAILRQHCLAHFALTGGLGTVEVAVNPPGAGRVRVNTLVPDTYLWTGLYFGDYATTLRPAAAPGFRFTGWTTPAGSNATPRLDWRIPHGATRAFTAHFAALPADAVPPVRLALAEINYHAADDFDAGDWIELHNPGPAPVELGGWSLRDGSRSGVLYLPDGPLAPGARQVVCRQRAKFQLAHPGGPDPLAEMPFGLDNGGDTLRLYDPAGHLVEALTYDDQAPWPAAADG